MYKIDTDKQIRLEQLKNIYQLFEQTMASFDVVCEEKCATCCTCNVTMTQLEAQYIALSLQQDEIKRLCNRILNFFPQKSYRPKITMNGFARRCIENKDIPEEENNPDWGKCPLLTDDRCTIYPYRPFGCRALLSEVHCKKKGYAQVPEIGQTYQTIFMQAIEHLDQGNSFGNLSDMMTVLLNIDSKKNIADNSLLVNEPVSAMMIPPEHRKKTEPVINHLIHIIQIQAK
ncbi:MAG: hypothetical protein GY707_15000 [Desulfobacteraceae bacterium]|nr:hypothetical protein [Desulfobacteraceae bacterium]